jgi:hypothetical protein
MIEQIGPYRVLEKLGEGDPPSLAAAFGRELRRDPAGAQLGRQR